MWFRLRLNPPHSIACLVGNDGKLYWNVNDVARLLQMKNPYMLGFQKGVKNRCVRGRQVLPVSINYPSLTLDCKLVQTDVLLDILKRRNPLTAECFSFAINHSKMIVLNADAGGNKYHKDCPSLQPSSDGTVTFYEWVQSFNDRIEREREKDQDWIRDLIGSDSMLVDSQEPEMTIPEAVVEEDDMGKMMVQLEGLETTLVSLDADRKILEQKIADVQVEIDRVQTEISRISSNPQNWSNY